MIERERDGEREPASRVDQLPAFHDLSASTLEIRLLSQNYALLPVLEILGKNSFSIEQLHVAIKHCFPNNSPQECMRIAQRMINTEGLFGCHDGHYIIQSEDYPLVFCQPIKVHTPADALATLRQALADQSNFASSTSPDDLLARAAIASNARKLAINAQINDFVFTKTGMLQPEWRQQVCRAICEDFQQKAEQSIGESTCDKARALGDILSESPFQFFFGASTAARLITVLKGESMQSEIANQDQVTRQAVSSGIRGALAGLPDWIRNLIKGKFRFSLNSAVKEEAENGADG
ncbi:MAG: hypothetical protein ACKOW9_02505 [Candidatus Paceibacterota bacterium]